MGKKTRILIEVERVRISYQSNRRHELLCRECEMVTDFISESDALTIIGSSPLNGYHSELEPNGQVMVCLRSIIEDH